MKPKKKTLLWEISHPENPGASYVFGTMHVRNLNIVTKQKGVFDKILACDTFACEYNLDNRTGFFSPDYYLIPGGQHLDDLIGKKKFQKLRKVFQKEVGFDLENHKNLKPILITNLLSELVLRKDMPHALDEYLWHFAKENERKLTGIETFEEQLTVFQKLDLTYQLQALLATGRSFSKFRKSLQKMTDYYLEGDIQKLYKASKKGSGKVRKLLLYNRNKIMAKRIDKMARTETLFSAIGAAHLGGEKGVLRLLKKEGWKLTPIKIR